MIGVLASVVFPFAFAAMLCLMNFDPFWFVLPKVQNQVLGITLWLLRFIGFSLAAYMGWLQLATVFMAAIFGVKIFKETQSCQNRWASRILKNVSSVSDAAGSYLAYIRNRKRSSNRTEPFVSMFEIFSIHRQVRIIMLTVNEAAHILFPVLLFIGESILVVSSYASIRMQDRIPMPFYLILPSLAFFVFLLIMILFPGASDVYEDSLAFLEAMRLVPGRNRYWRKAWKAERAIGISMGGLFVAKQSTKSTFLVQCIDATIDALLAT
jgi:hypothetical protein